MDYLTYEQAEEFCHLLGNAVDTAAGIRPNPDPERLGFSLGILRYLSFEIRDLSDKGLTPYDLPLVSGFLSFGTGDMILPQNGLTIHSAEPTTVEGLYAHTRRRYLVGNPKYYPKKQYRANPPDAMANVQRHTEIEVDPSITDYADLRAIAAESNKALQQPVETRNSLASIHSCFNETRTLPLPMTDADFYSLQSLIHNLTQP